MTSGGIRTTRRFNPRALRGATWHFRPAVLRVAVSIHAPLRGATGDPRSATRARRRFNPRAPAERDRNRAPFVGNLTWFQSTRPCGVRRDAYIAPMRERPKFQSMRPYGARLPKEFVPRD
ncbi:Hypothetical protein I596_2487 [Dokdonella koreensis DS-123]|uniref:Uncharacterized protein n=1 Tax=Dokdonella koreensis DS-123 TaxID=1300342 RepID=A0A167H1E5_9GAMM|nr:Hypothetical protein I596_2487 [Dokdonella koreensis DS-123]